jgi:hypothetical protein
MTTYRIELEEIYDKEMEGMTELFTSFDCKIYEDDILTIKLPLRSVNSRRGLLPILMVMLKKIYDFDCGDMPEED